MSKKLYLAPAAGGKSSYTRDLARSTAASLQAEVRVCVPTRLQANAWRAALAAAGGSIGVHVLTFDQLIASCLSLAGEAYTQLSDPVLYRLLRTIINQLPLVHYAPLKAKPGFIQVAKEVINELKAALVDPRDFKEAVRALGAEPRLSELAGIYGAYQEKLQAAGWADRVGLHWLAVEALRERAPGCCRDWPLLIVDGFDDFTPSQLALLALLADRVGDFVITLPAAEGIAYPRYTATQAEVERALDLSAEPLPLATPSATHPTLRHLARQIFEDAAPDKQPAEDAVALREAADRVAEARTALRWLKQRIVIDGFSPGEVALLARNITPYSAFIQQIATEFGLPVRLVDGLPLGKSPVIAALLALLRLFLPLDPGGEADLPRRPVIASWRSPYFAWQNDDWAINPADADRLDKFARDQRVIRGWSQWQAAFAAGISARERTESDEEEGEGLPVTGPAVQELKEKFDHFIAVTRPPQGEATIQEFVAWLEKLIGPDLESQRENPAPSDSLNITARTRANPETAVADIAALNTLKDILRGLVWAEEALPGSLPMNFSAFFNELNGAIAAGHFMLPARAGQPEILVADAPAVRGLSFAAVAVMGLSEGSFPETLSEDPFLRDLDRQQLRGQFEIILQPSTQSAEREYFYEAITRPRRKLLLTRPMLAENGAEWVASPFWEAARRLVSAEVEPIASEALLPLAETASWAEWWETVADMAADPPETHHAQAEQAWSNILTAARIWEARASTGPSVWDGALDALAGELGSRYGPERIWSATRLEAYQTCGFLFFAQNVLKLAPRPEPAEGLDTRQLGSLYHNIFERVTQVKGLDPTNEAQVRQAVIQLATPILDAAPEAEGFRETPWWAHTRAEIMDNVIASVLALASGEYEFFQAERRFGIGGPPLIIPGAEDQLQLRGFIDRLDRDAYGRLRVVDYKLGGPSTYNARAFHEGKKLQLPLYALAAQDALGLGPVAEGFYWHFRSAEHSSFTLAKADGGVAGAMETAVAYAWDAVHKIRDGQFQPQPPDGGCPGYCPAAAFCWQFTPRSY